MNKYYISSEPRDIWAKRRLGTVIYPSLHKLLWDVCAMERMSHLQVYRESNNETSDEFVFHVDELLSEMREFLDGIGFDHYECFE